MGCILNSQCTFPGVWLPKESIGKEGGRPAGIEQDRTFEGRANGFLVLEWISIVACEWWNPRCHVTSCPRYRAK